MLFCPAEASVPGGLLNDEENQTWKFPQHPPAMANDPGYRLIFAIHQGDLGTVKSLLDLYGLPLPKLRSQRYHFLCESLLSEQTDIAKLLLEHGADVNESKDDLITPLHYAADLGNNELVSMLLEKNALVNAEDEHNDTPLHNAVARKNLKIIKLLLNKMANIEAKTNEGSTPLHLAVGLLGLAETSEDNLDHTLASRCKLCISNLNVTMDTTDATKTYTSGEEVVKLLLDRGADVDARNADGKTVLEVAVVQCNFRIIERILLARPAVKGKANENCLRIAVKSAGVEYREIVELLVAYGFTLKRRDAKHHGLLHNAVRNGYTTIVGDLLKLGADVEVKHKIANYGTLLHSAAASGRIRIVELLVEHGADVNAKDVMGKTPILYAVENMDPVMTEFFLTNGANDEGKSSLIHTAAAQGCSHIMKMILDRISSIDVNVVDNVAYTSRRFVEMNQRSRFWGSIYRDTFRTNYDLTALHVAAAGGFATVVELLLEHNAKVGALAQKFGTPLHCSILQRNEAIVEMLLLNGAEVDAKRGDGKTPLHLAVEEGNVNAFNVLIKHGADVHGRNNEGQNLVYTAIEVDHLKMFEEDLLDVLKASHPKDINGLTALQYAVRIGSLADVEILLRHGADASVEDTHGRTPLHNASRYGWEKIVEALLVSLDNVDAEDIYGNTAFHEALKGPHPAVVRVLLFHGCNFNVEDKLGRRSLDILRWAEIYLRHLDMEDSSSSSSSDDSYDSSRKIIAECKRRKAAMVEEQMGKMIALELHVNGDNTDFIDVLTLTDDCIYGRCKEEIESMKGTKIGESKVSFYEFLTTGKRQLTFYSRNRIVAEALEKGDHKDTFKLYCDLIDWRFRKAKIINDLIDSSARSLSALSGYSLSDYDHLEIFGYLGRRDLENVIKAGPSAEKSKKKEEIFNSNFKKKKKKNHKTKFMT